MCHTAAQKDKKVGAAFKKPLWFRIWACVCKTPRTLAGHAAHKKLTCFTLWRNGLRNMKLGSFAICKEKIVGNMRKELFWERMKIREKFQWHLKGRRNNKELVKKLRRKWSQKVSRKLKNSVWTPRNLLKSGVSAAQCFKEADYFGKRLRKLRYVPHISSAYSVREKCVPYLQNFFLFYNLYTLVRLPC